ncbi:DDB1- and CUL4-associated factor 8 isoform X2 [Neocloeon triangulifer]|uniref:DDB1- and CUL4-associated factor 8 isoform X2 n=1 Tax=Neocloeon triangulifer TaxID=2078957 RepID=UPI00286F42D7|nr:DDB1- and CUL4-associated factor 8 isoform X2 [Neocloeon triangulifer]
MEEKKEEKEKLNSAAPMAEDGPSSGSKDDAAEGSSKSPTRKPAQDGEPADGPETKTRRLDSDSSMSSGVFKKRSSSSRRNYRKSSRGSGDESSDSEEDTGAQPTEPEQQQVDMSEDSSDSGPLNARLRAIGGDISSSSSSTTSGPDSPAGIIDRRKSSESEGNDEDESMPVVLTKRKPSHKWHMVQEVASRQYGTSTKKQMPVLFTDRFYGSRHAVERLELMYKLDEHHGCVNALNFNESGSKLVSGSDDMRVIVWDWAIGKKYLEFVSGHRSNVFQTKFMPGSNDSLIVTCARDGQVRLATLSTTGTCRGTRKLAQHNQSAHKLTLHPECPEEILSAGEDGFVISIDLRQPTPNKLLLVREAGKKVPLYSISSHPLDLNEFCLGGRDQFVRFYDKRYPKQLVKKFKPQHMGDSNTNCQITCAVYNYNGTEVLASYNDDDIFLFDTRHSDGADYVHRYEGHRNSATVKGVNFFGPRSEYVVSGSDCGNLFFWDKETEAILQFMHGDENGVVNCLEPHPHVPILATSGLDDDVKIWIPSYEDAPAMANLKQTVISNSKGRVDERSGNAESFDGQMLWYLWRQIRRSNATRRAHLRAQMATENSEGEVEGEAGNMISSSSEDGDDADSDGDDEEEPRAARVQCSPS